MSRWANKYVIGLTGNIAVGKSVVRQMLQHLGAYTIDADGLTHQAMTPGAPAYKPVVETFGRFILDGDGRINRNLLGSIVFSYPEALGRLEAIVHPIVIQAVNTLISRAKQRVIVVEAIKLLESDLLDIVDTVWVVDASPETQFRRLMDKRRMSEDEARKRIVIQRPQLEKLRRASVIINNDGSVDDTWRQVQNAWADVRRALHEPSAPEEPKPIQPAAQPRAASLVKPPAPQPAAPPLASITIRRGMPGNADIIARFISHNTGKPVDRMDIMLAFGQKSYLLAQDGAERIVAVMGWQVENLISRADELYLEPDIPRQPVISALIAAVEEASKELQSEVGFILLPADAPPDIVQPFLDSGYESTTVEQIRIPAWREAVHELISENPRILAKKLRADRVMKPI